jgi:hypothetical protein
MLKKKKNTKKAQVGLLLYKVLEFYSLIVLNSVIYLHDFFFHFKLPDSPTAEVFITEKAHLFKANEKLRPCPKSDQNYFRKTS